MPIDLKNEAKVDTFYAVGQSMVEGKRKEEKKDTEFIIFPPFSFLLVNDPLQKYF